jgi:hypothetical protein
MTAPKKQEPAKPSWEIKDRMYIVIGQAPLTLTISSKHTSRHPLLYFDKEKGVQREIRYATNQNSPFVDEQSGQVTLGHIMFKDGALYVKKEQQNLQKLLSLYHPLLGNKYYEVSSMTTKELKRDLLLFAKRQPDLFMELANDDNVQLRNIAIKASEMGIIKLSQDQRTFTWGSNGRKLMTVPFDENPYSAMAAYFKTDEGVEVYRSVEKNLE